MQMTTVVWFLLTLSELARAQDTCNDNTSSVRLSITSSKNETGHEQIQFGLMHVAEGRFSPWIIDVEQRASNCGGKKIQFIRSTYKDASSSSKDYEFYPMIGRYKFHTTPKTWFEAFHVCQEEGAHLAVINSDDEAQILKEMFKSGPKITGTNFDFLAFLGFTDLVKEGSYVTVLGQPLSETGFAKWDANEPNNAGASATQPGQDCGAIIGNTGLLDDVNCKEKLAFFCEQQL